MDYNILNLIKPDINFSKTETAQGEKSSNMSLIIKFNIPLDPSILDNDSAFVADSKGTVIPSSVKYDKTQNAIKLIISNGWQEGSCYFLNIGGNIKSQSGHSLSGSVRFRFYVKDGKPSDFLLVSGKTALGANRVNSNLRKADVQIIDKLPIKKKKDGMKIGKHLPYRFNIFMILMFFAGVIFFVLSYILSSSTFLYLGIAASSFFCIYLLAYLSSQRGRSLVQYNLGAFFYNINQYEKSVSHFEKSLYYDKKNIKSKLALDLAFSQYLSKM